MVVRGETLVCGKGGGGLVGGVSRTGAIWAMGWLVVGFGRGWDIW